MRPHWSTVCRQFESDTSFLYIFHGPKRFVLSMSVQKQNWPVHFNYERFFSRKHLRFSRIASLLQTQFRSKLWLTLHRKRALSKAPQANEGHFKITKIPCYKTITVARYPPTRKLSIQEFKRKYATQALLRLKTWTPRFSLLLITSVMFCRVPNLQTVD